MNDNIYILHKYIIAYILFSALKLIMQFNLIMMYFGYIILNVLIIVTIIGRKPKQSRYRGWKLEAQ